MLFQQAKIAEALGGSGYNTERLATPYIPQFTGTHRCRHASVDWDEEELYPAVLWNQIHFISNVRNVKRN